MSRGFYLGCWCVALFCLHTACENASSQAPQHLTSAASGYAPASDKWTRAGLLPILGAPYPEQVPTPSMQARRTEAQHLALRHPGKVWINGHLQRKAVALTFDDGPESVVTPQVLDILARYQLKATFFFVGFMLRKHAAVVKRTYHEGHLILNHSYDHPSFDALSNAQIQSQLRRTEDLLFKLIGKRPALFRPPAGVIDNRIQAEIDAAGYQTILWSYDPFDWAGLPVDTLVQRVVSQARNGEIILLHSRLHTDSTAVALPRIIEGLQARGFELLRLDELIPVQAYR